MIDYERQKYCLWKWRVTSGILAVIVVVLLVAKVLEPHSTIPAWIGW